MNKQTLRDSIALMSIVAGLFLTACQPIQPEASALPSLEFSELEIPGLRQNLATQLNVTAAEVTIVNAEPVDWPDACLGLTGAGEICAAVITPGYQVTLEVNGEQYTYHTDLSGENSRLAEALAPQNSDIPANTLDDSPIFVDEVIVNLLESKPVQVNAVVRGMLPDPCTKITKALAQLEGNTFVIIIATERDDKMMCAQVLSPFEQVIKLDVKGLAVGEYSVVANEVRTTFTLQ